MEPLVEQNSLKQSQSKLRFAFMRPAHQLTINQHYPMGSGHDISLDPASGKLKHSLPYEPKGAHPADS